MVNHFQVMICLELQTIDEKYGSWSLSGQRISCENVMCRIDRQGRFLKMILS